MFLIILLILKLSVASEKALILLKDFFFPIGYWDNPKNGGNQVIFGNESVFVGAWISGYYIREDDLTKREFIKGGDIMFLFSMQGRFYNVTSEN